MNATENLPHWEGWTLIGAYPDHEPGDVGSWLLTDGGEAMLLEVPEGLTVVDVRQALADKGTKLRYVTASHDHWDHLDRNVWGGLARAFPRAQFQFFRQTRALVLENVDKVSSPGVTQTAPEEETHVHQPTVPRLRHRWLPLSQPTFS